MNCESLRERLAEDPSRANAEFDRHAETCAPCEAYRQRLLHAETLIHRALRFDVGAVSRPSVATRRQTRRRTTWVPLVSGIAAGILVAVTFWGLFGGGAYLSPEQLAVEVTEHWYHEPDAWVVSNEPIDGATLMRVLDGEAELDIAALQTISYAESCWVGGQWIPHLIVQGRQGPYMVLLMPEIRLESPVDLELREEGLVGRIVPAGTGSIAVLGGAAAEADAVEAAFVAAVDWTI